MKTAIVILNYNDYDTTFDMIQRIKDFKELDLIIIVDNHSNDNSFEKLKKLENNKIIVIQTDKNKGYAYGNNYGLKYLKSKKIDYVIISNPDVIVSENVIKKLKIDLKDDNITLVAPKILERGEYSKGWKIPNFKEDLISNITYFHKYAKKMLSYDETYYKDELVSVDVVSGCFFMIKYDRFEEIDFFDTNTFLYYEENILGCKLKKLKFKSYLDTSIEVKHNLSVSVNKNFNSIKKYKILKQSQIYYEKNYKKLNILGIIILKIFYYISLFISYIHVFILSLRRNK